MQEISAQIRVVIEARKQAADLRSSWEANKAAWMAIHQYEYDALLQAQTEQMVQEDKLRSLTLQAYAETGNKAPAPGVGIRMVTKLDYLPDKAFACNGLGGCVSPNAGSARGEAVKKFRRGATIKDMGELITQLEGGDGWVYWHQRPLIASFVMGMPLRTVMGALKLGVISEAILPYPRAERDKQ